MLYDCQSAKITCKSSKPHSPQAENSHTYWLGYEQLFPCVYFYEIFSTMPASYRIYSLKCEIKSLLPHSINIDIMFDIRQDQNDWSINQMNGLNLLIGWGGSLIFSI